MFEYFPEPQAALHWAAWQSLFSRFFQNPLQFLQAAIQEANWPLLVGMGVLALAALLLLKVLWGVVTRHRPQAPDKQGEGISPAIFEELDAGAALLDSNDRLLYANPALQRLLGYSAQELHHAPLVNFAHPEDARLDNASLDNLKSGRSRTKYSVERRFYHQDGRLLWLRQNVVACSDLKIKLSESTPEAAALAFFEDITRRHVAESELLVAREAIHNLYEVIADRQLDLMQKLQALLRMGCRRFGTETGVIGQIVDNGFEVLQVVSPDERIRRGKVYERSTEASGSHESVTIRNHRLVQTVESTGGDFSHDWRNFPFYSSADFEVFLSAPIQVLGQTFGVLCFSDLDSREEPFTSADREFLQLMAQWLASELERLQALAELENKQEALQNANTKLEALATVDGLTGAKNRRAFNDQLEMEFRRARRYSTPLSLLLLDADNFKSFNDTFGHLAGDEVLITLAQTLMENVRVIDFVARYGGEEFVVVLPNTDRDGAMVLADRLRENIQNVRWPQRQVTSSVGVATLADEMKEATELTHAADQALYASKEAGRNKCTHVEELTAA